MPLPAELHIVEALVAREHRRLDSLPGRLGDGIDCTTRRVAAEQCALRAFQDFDALDGAERLRSAVGEWVIDTVDVGRDARLGIRKECIGTAATNVDDHEVDSQNGRASCRERGVQYV